jgi:xylulokinase
VLRRTASGPPLRLPMQPRELFLGADLGTSALKLAAVTPGGELHAAARIPYGAPRGRAGRAEDDPRRWWRALRVGLAQLAERIPLHQVVGIGCCGQTRAQVFLGPSGRVLYPAILWADQRAAAEAKELAERFAARRPNGRRAVPLTFDASAPLARLYWMRRHEPAVLEATRSVLQPKDFLVHRLTGAWAGDVPSNFQLLRRFDPPAATPLLGELGVPESLLPPLHAPWQVVGAVSARAGRATGLRPGVPVVAGTQDGLCTAIGIGGAADGVAVDITGSTDSVGLCTRRRPRSGRVGIVPIATGLTFCGGPTQVSGEALQWLAEAIGLPLGAEGARQALPVLRLAERAPAREGGPLFLPFLLGARAPLWDASARGVLFGLARWHGPRQLARAVVEGIAFSVRHLLEAAEAAAGVRAFEVRVAGPAGGSAFWNQLKADVLGRPVRQPAVLEGGVMGAALLAAVGTGRYADVTQAAQRMVRVVRSYRPGAGRRRYGARYAVYRELAEGLRPVFARLERPAPEAAPGAGRGRGGPAARRQRRGEP